MLVRLLVLFVVMQAFAACVPSNKCSGELYFYEDAYECLKCPEKSNFKDGTCVCQDGYEFSNRQCMLKDGAVPVIPDAGSQPDADSASDDTGGGGAGCEDYCSFNSECWGSNSIAMSVLPDIVMGLHADDPAACKTSCEKALGSMESTSEALGCFVEGRADSGCKNADETVGLGKTIDLTGQCCRSHTGDPLCKAICTTLKANALASQRIDYCP
jgi:hypothetical protein